MTETATTKTALLDEPARAFMKRAMAGGLVKLDDAKKVVASLIADGASLSAEGLAEGLVAAGELTHWQASKVLGGKSKGFFLGSYRLLRPLGRGGMGVVYLGEHHIMKRLMALKILPGDALKDERRIERFKDEARATAQLDHPGIVRAYDCAEAADKIYIVMEYVDGVNLQQAVVRDGLMSVAAAMDAVQQAAEALAHAHSRGIVHRDVKPSNLMLRRDGIVKVSDLGLARIGWDMEGQEKESKRLTGTADFVAPEQVINSKTVDARADIYSLGCTLYFLLSGKVPFGGQTLQQRLAKHQTSPTPDVRSIRQDCPASVADLVARMMAKRPEDRPASMADLLVQIRKLRGVDGFEADGVRRPLQQIAVASGTSVEDVTLSVTEMGDSSLGSTDMPLDSASADGSFESFDFSDLPDVAAPSSGSFGGTAAPLGLANPHAANMGQAIRNSPASPPSAGGQQVLLGVGLAFAVLALVTVIGMMAYTLAKPMEQTQPRLKTTEQKDGTIIIMKTSE
ncbi:MAG: serine/threonine-protein kinase [Planctomycetota bacterium]